MDEKHAATRAKMHEALDKMLDLVDAGGYDNEEVTVVVQAVNIETTDTELIEDVSRFVTEFASGEVEEMFVDHKVIVNGGEKSATRTQII